MDALESRFADLQRRVLGSLTVDAYERNQASTPRVADLLLDASSAMRTALSGREKVNSMTPRMTDLDNYLDPTFEDSIDSSALFEAVESSESAMRRRCEDLGRLVEMSPVLDSQAIGGAATHGDRLERLLLAGLEAREMSEGGCSRAYELVEQYNAVVVNITKTLVQWDNLVTQIELERKPKKVVE